MRALLIIAVLLVGCIPEAGFMTTRPHLGREDVPISVCSVAYVDSIDARKPVAWALGTINERLGFSVYKLMDAGSTECDATVTVGVPSEAGWRDPGGDMIFNAATLTGLRCPISTSNTGTDEILFYVVEHELGHCLGLDHDDWDGSIMRRVQRERGDMEWPPWISDHDRALIRDTYM